MTREELVEWFDHWESGSRDTIDVKRCYVDICDDLVAGILLSQVVYYFLRGRRNMERTDFRDPDGTRWIRRGREEWWDECRIREKAFDRAFAILEAKGFVRMELRQWGRTRKICITCDVGAVAEAVAGVVTPSRIGNLSPSHNGNLSDAEHPPESGTCHPPESGTCDIVYKERASEDSHPDEIYPEETREGDVVETTGPPPPISNRKRGPGPVTRKADLRLTRPILENCRMRFAYLDRQDLEDELANLQDSDQHPPNVTDWTGRLMIWFDRENKRRKLAGRPPIPPGEWDNVATPNDRVAHLRREWETAVAAREETNAARLALGRPPLPGIPPFEEWREGNEA